MTLFKNCNRNLRYDTNTSIAYHATIYDPYQKRLLLLGRLNLEAMIQPRFALAFWITMVTVVKILFLQTPDNKHALGFVAGAEVVAQYVGNAAEVRVFRQELELEKDVKKKSDRRITFVHLITLTPSYFKLQRTLEVLIILTPMYFQMEMYLCDDQRLQCVLSRRSWYFPEEI